MHPEDEHLDCSSDSPLGCSRCRPNPSRLCCDVCTPTLLADFEILLNLDTTAQSRTGRSTVRKHDPTSLDMALQDKLEQWREDTAKEVWGAALYHNYGPKVFLSDELLDRILLCTGTGKLLSASDIAKETGWVDAVEFGSSILNVVQKVHHLPMPTPVPMPVPVSAHPAPPSIVSPQGSVEHPTAKATTHQDVKNITKCRAFTCSECGLVGHNGECIFLLIRGQELNVVL